jgi:hypothetical protein
VSPPPPLPLTEAEADAPPEAAAEEEAAGRPDESESTGLEAEADDDGPSGPRVVDNDGRAGVGAASSETEEEDGSGPAAEDAVLETTSPAEVEVASVEEEVMAGSPLSAALLLLLLLPSLLLGLALADGSITAGQLEEAVAAAAAADDDDGGSWSAPSAAGRVEVGGEGQGPAAGEDEVSVWSPKDRAPPAAEKEVTAAVAVGAADGKKEAEGGLIDGGCGCWTSAGEAAVVVG